MCYYTATPLVETSSDSVHCARILLREAAVGALVDEDGWTILYTAVQLADEECLTLALSVAGTSPYWKSPEPDSL